MCHHQSSDTAADVQGGHIRLGSKVKESHLSYLRGITHSVIYIQYNIYNIIAFFGKSSGPLSVRVKEIASTVCPAKRVCAAHLRSRDADEVLVHSLPPHNAGGRGCVRKGSKSITHCLPCFLYIYIYRRSSHLSSCWVLSQ